MTAAIDTVAAAFPAGERRDERTISPLALAYLGDTVYDLYVRAWLVDRTAHTTHDLHLLAARRVCAAGQAAAYKRVEDMLTEEELGVYRRGRNAHSGTTPRNASSADYHAATGLEALLGYLWLAGRDERVTALMRRILEGE